MSIDTSTINNSKPSHKATCLGGHIVTTCIIDNEKLNHDSQPLIVSILLCHPETSRAIKLDLHSLFVILHLVTTWCTFWRLQVSQHPVINHWLHFIHQMMWRLMMDVKHVPLEWPLSFSFFLSKRAILSAIRASFSQFPSGPSLSLTHSVQTVRGHCIFRGVSGHCT
jgi:hypothetical protein